MGHPTKHVVLLLTPHWSKVRRMSTATAQLIIEPLTRTAMKSGEEGPHLRRRHSLPGMHIKRIFQHLSQPQRQHNDYDDAQQ